MDECQHKREKVRRFPNHGGGQRYCEDCGREGNRVDEGTFRVLMEGDWIRQHVGDVQFRFNFEGVVKFLIGIGCKRGRLVETGLGTLELEVPKGFETMVREALMWVCPVSVGLTITRLSWWRCRFKPYVLVEKKPRLH